MGVTAREMMETDFVALRPWNTISQAVDAFHRANVKRGQKTFGLVVTDDENRLAGILSLYDVLNLLRPKHIHIWGEMHDVDISGYLDESCRRAKAIQVGDIMSTDVVRVNPDAHLLMVIDLMIKKHVRRVPVVEDERVIGIVYASSLFYQLIERLRD
ncbi:MAG: CBS domain-containing protein [Deltaproteobacteria bacterium]|nr:CBS domain-containing protein [Deltaproteobacteria bacterium]